MSLRPSGRGLFRVPKHFPRSPVDTAWCNTNDATEIEVDWDALDVDYGTLAGAAEIGGTVWLIEADPRTGTAGASGAGIHGCDGCCQQ